MAHNARKRCIKRNYEGTHDRFLRDPVFRNSQLKIGWTEEKCIAMNKLAQENHSYNLSREEYLRYPKHWYLTLNKSGKNAPMRLRSDFRAAFTITNRLHRESGEERAEPYSFSTVPKAAPFLLKFNMVALGQKLVELMKRIHCFIWFVAVGSFTAGSNLLQPTGGVNSTPHTSPFSRSQRARMMCDTTVAQVLVRVIPCVMRLSDCLFSPFSSPCSLPCVSPISSA